MMLTGQYHCATENLLEIWRLADKKRYDVLYTQLILVIPINYSSGWCLVTSNLIVSGKR